MRMIRHVLYVLLILSRLAVWAVAEPEAFLTPHAIGHEHPSDEEHHHGDEDDRHESPDSPCHHHDDHCACAGPPDQSMLFPETDRLTDGLQGARDLLGDDSPHFRVRVHDIFHPPLG